MYGPVSLRIVSSPDCFKYLAIAWRPLLLRMSVRSLLAFSVVVVPADGEKLGSVVASMLFVVSPSWAASGVASVVEEMWNEL